MRSSRNAEAARDAGAAHWITLDVSRLTLESLHKRGNYGISETRLGLSHVFLTIHAVRELPG